MWHNRDNRITSMKKIRILVADDHAVVRMGFVALLESEPDIEVVAEAGDGEIAVKQAHATNPDVILMDLVMPKLNGTEATAKIKAKNPDVKVLILTSSGDVGEIGRALEAGADGALLKSENYTVVVKALRALVSGERYVSSIIRKMLSERTPAVTLSSRQQEVLEALSRGLTNTDIAKLLNISPDGVKFHITALLAKLGAANRSEAITIAMKNHLLKI